MGQTYADNPADLIEFSVTSHHTPLSS
jgi:hypothetical protein